jgi:hypothetical protein
MEERKRGKEGGSDGGKEVREGVTEEKEVGGSDGGRGGREGMTEGERGVMEGGRGREERSDERGK